LAVGVGSAGGVRTADEPPVTGALAGGATVDSTADGPDNVGTDDDAAPTGSSVVTVARDPEPQFVHGAVVVAGLA
jgi:hypothetical protein